MNKDKAKDYLPLVQALAEGKVIQIARTAGGWIDVEEINSDFEVSYYRIKPEPREWWYNRYPDGRECGGYYTELSAMKYSDSDAVQVRYREVIE